MSKTKSNIYLYYTLYFFFTLSVLCYLLYTSSKIQSVYLKDNGYIRDILQNWYTKGISEIRVANKSEECEKYFYTREWEGIKQACDCRKSHQYGKSSDVYFNKCSLVNLILGCKNTNKVESIVTHSWKGAKLCIKNTDFNYFDTITTIDQKCPKNYHLCGVDSKNFGLCLPTSHHCPINRIKIVNLPSYDKKLFQSIKLNDDWNLLYSNKFLNDSLTINIKYSEGRICVNPDETNLKLQYLKYKTGNKTVEDLDKNHSNYCHTKIGKFTHDERYKSLDSMSKFKYFNNNDILGMIETLPQVHSQELINYNSHLYQRSYIHWSPYCRHDAQYDPIKIVDDLIFVSQTQTHFQFLGGLLYLILFIFLLEAILFFIENLTQGTYKVHSFISLFNFSLVCGFLVVCGLSIYLVYKNKFLVHKFQDLKCGEYLTNNAFNNLGNNIHETNLNSVEIFLGSVILLSCLVINKLIR